MLAKNNSICLGLILLSLALFVAGCTPAGPRAFLAGKKYLDQGDYASASDEFKTAATLLATNAQVWNYYGVALQGDHQLQAAASAYQRALDLNRDLVEAHFNLGCLWLEQNDADAAKTEFTAYTLRRNNDPAGWLKLGFAELRLGETVSAERCFSAVLSLKPGDAQAYNGLGLARIQRGMPRDAARFFAAAVQTEPGYAAAMLNLATVSQQFLHDTNTALINYRAYLNLNPRPADWDQVNALANQLEQRQLFASRPAPATTAFEERVPESVATPPVRGSSPPSNESRSETAPRLKPPPVEVYDRAPTTSFPPRPVQVVQVQPPPEIVTSPRAAGNLSSRPANHPPVVAQPAVELPMPAENNPSFWHRLFNPAKSGNQAESQYLSNGETPLPNSNSTADFANPAAANPARNPPAPKLPAVSLASFPRYHYTSPAKPSPGDHSTGSQAAGSFTQAQVFEQEEKWSDALQYYEQAAQADPSWYVAQYNTAVLAHRLRIYSLALPSYENALALEPDSLDARYNFALALRSAGYIPDAVTQLKKVLAAAPGEARAHLTLANIYAQVLHEPSEARPHYLKVLELEPDSPQASDIRFWLEANPT